MARAFHEVHDLSYPPEAVWRGLTVASLMQLWVMNFDQDEGEMTTDFQPVVGTAYRMEAKKGRGWRGYVVGRVLEVVPCRRLVYTWSHSAYQDRHPAQVEFVLEANGEGTRLRMTQSGFPGLRGWFVRLGARLGWKRMLGSGLPAVLARDARERPWDAHHRDARRSGPVQRTRPPS